MPTTRLATRGSPLALRQAELVATRLRAVERALEVELVIVSTTGDERGDVPLHLLGGLGVFTSEIERAVAHGRADVAVHSAKDLPAAALSDGLVLAAVPERADARDCLVGRALADLGPDATVATGSIRRRVQLAALRPDLRFVELRGNIATRIERIPAGGAGVVALAAMRRLGLEAEVAQVLETTEMLPQIGQGALALTCRAGDAATVERLVAIDDTDAHRAVRAERAYLARLGGGCEAPVGAYATVLDSGELELEAMIASDSGRVVLRERRTGSDPELLGAELAAALVVRAQREGILEAGGE